MAQINDVSENYTDSQKKIAEKAKNYFISGLHCSEAVVKTLNEEYALEFTEPMIKMATGFGGGLGKAKSLCGTVSGGVMVLSSIYGRTEMHGDDSMAFDLAKEFHDRFQEINESVICKELTSKIEWGHPSHIKQCSDYVYEATLILSNILDRCIEDFGPLIPEKKKSRKNSRGGK